MNQAEPADGEIEGDNGDSTMNGGVEDLDLDGDMDAGEVDEVRARVRNFVFDDWLLINLKLNCYNLQKY